MDIILWRHAEAEPANPGGSDMARQLTAEGRMQARRMADWLLGYLPLDANILVSPARRTLQTADALGRPYAVKVELEPDRDADQALTLIGAAKSKSGIFIADQAGTPLAARRTLLVVGHQPMLGRIASSLLSGVASDWPLDKAAVLWFGGGEGGTTLRAAMEPSLRAARKPSP